MSQRSKFVRGGGGVFRCGVCVRSTRLVDQAHGSTLCPECWELAGMDNTVNDCGPETLNAGTIAMRDRLLGVIIERGGDPERVKALNEYLWPRQGA